MGRLYDLMVALALPIAIVVSVFSAPLISLLYGPSYAESAPILAIHVWAGPFVFLGRRPEPLADRRGPAPFLARPPRHRGDS